MRIGILTYSIGNNYGALLQAFALETYLKMQGHDVQFIYYYHPWSKGDSFFRVRSYLGRTPYLTLRKIKNMYLLFSVRRVFSRVEKSFERSRHYGSCVELLCKEPPEYDAIIVGSDQVWNYGFGRLHYQLPYFLPWGGCRVKKIAYAASFGGRCVLESDRSQISKLLSDFYAISVREKSGKDEVRRLGLDSSVVPDPTLLLNATDYLNVFKLKKTQELKNTCFTYFLHVQQGYYDDFLESLKKIFCIRNVTLHGYRICDSQNVIPDLKGFLNMIQESSLVVTNSFHCTVFSILFHRPFMVLLLEGTIASMNTRFDTLLTSLGLERRMVISKESARELPKLLNDTIDWDDVDRRLIRLRKVGVDFLETFLK